MTANQIPVGGEWHEASVESLDEAVVGGYGLIDSWKAAKRPVEFHLYEPGGHGFGMYPKETTSTGWFEAFVRWIAMHGMLKPGI